MCIVRWPKRVFILLMTLYPMITVNSLAYISNYECFYNVYRRTSTDEYMSSFSFTICQTSPSMKTRFFYYSLLSFHCNFISKLRGFRNLLYPAAFTLLHFILRPLIPLITTIRWAEPGISFAEMLRSALHAAAFHHMPSGKGYYSSSTSE